HRAPRSRDERFEHGNLGVRVVRLATYNIHGWRGADGRRSVDRIADVIAELDADVVALQEVDAPGHAEREGPLQKLAERVGMESVAGPTIVGPSRRYGNALLTRLSVGAVRRIDISVLGREPRGLLDVDLRTARGELRVLVTHFGLRPFERGRQVETLCEAIRGRGDVPTAVMGDFNEWWPRGLTLSRLHDIMGYAPPTRSWPARCPILALDRIWLRPSTALKRVWALRSAGARGASDHLPVCADVDISALHEPVGQPG
ncbi:MAG: endonuclease/exonuclease/phosphatase family protein, partial [Polyangiaceae bacterium]